MSQTSVAATNALANKQFSKALSVMASRAPTPIQALTGPLPTESDAMNKLARFQSTNDMPIVQVTELAKGPGTKVQIDCAHIVKLRAVMGDRNASGLGASLKYSTQDIDIDMATIPVSAGGKMSQQRTPHSLRKNALNQLKSGMPRFRWQRILAMLAGMRGSQDGNDWILPLATDPEFSEMLINPLKAPTYNRHWVVNGTSLTQGGLQVASIATTDKLLLSHIDELAAIWDEMTIKMSAIQIPGDPAAGDDPIKGILFVDPLAWDTLITDTTSGNNIRTFETNALKRANYDGVRQHPLFSGSPFLWNGVLVRKMQYGIRLGASASFNYVAVANKLTASETAGTVAAGLSTTHQLCRSVFLGAQALGMASGANQASGETYTLLENSADNFGRNLELAGELIGGEYKLRFSLPNAAGDLEPTDFGVAVIDSVARIRSV